MSRNREEYWQTIDVMRVGGTAHAYQQKVEFRQEMKSDSKKHQFKDGIGHGIGLAMATVPLDEHRMVPVSETISDENAKELLNARSD